jgi:hypothetical protein
LKSIAYNDFLGKPGKIYEMWVCATIFEEREIIARIDRDKEEGAENHTHFGSKSPC